MTTSKPAGCPICRKPIDRAFRPFCSKRCAAVDLQRWFTGAYAIPDQEPDGRDAAGAIADDDD